ncbi:MAG: hypothetical protein ACK4P2_10075 [Hyphomonas sp.]
MRHLLIALAPAALFACGAPDAPAAEAPVPVQPVAQAQPAETDAPPRPPVELTEAAGSWTRTSDGSRPMVVYASADGAPLFSVTCLATSNVADEPVLDIKSVSSGDEFAGNIDIFTSAGNARLPASPDTSPGRAAGLTETVGQVPYVLAAGAGEIKIVSGTQGVSFETDPMLKALIYDCRPGFDSAPRRSADQTEGEEATGDAPAETPSGT